MEKECHICPIKEYPIFETKYWKVFLSWDQNYLGRCLISSKRHVESLSKLTDEEMVDFHRVTEKLETGLKKAFPFTLFNWGCLMNHAFKEKPYNPHVHWHMKPRHDEPITFDGQTWVDTDFGRHYIAKSSNILPKEKLDKILEHIKQFIE